MREIVKVKTVIRLISLKISTNEDLIREFSLDNLVKKKLENLNSDLRNAKLCILESVYREGKTTLQAIKEAKKNLKIRTYSTFFSTFFAKSTKKDSAKRKMNTVQRNPLLSTPLGFFLDRNLQDEGPQKYNNCLTAVGGNHRDIEPNIAGVSFYRDRR